MLVDATADHPALDQNKWFYTITSGELSITVIGILINM